MKSELSKAREHEADLIQQNSNLEKEQYRLKAISKADEIKQELESKIEDLRLDHQDKMIEVHRADDALNRKRRRDNENVNIFNLEKNR